ncbi:MAG TPA: hypothetical protein VFQ53_07525 [Kofleriaceae bacterium]|nr:hypothetical protein [Kofleriaceae bacterium]
MMRVGLRVLQTVPASADVRPVFFDELGDDALDHALASLQPGAERTIVCVRDLVAQLVESALQRLAQDLGLLGIEGGHHAVTGLQHMFHASSGVA